MIFSLEFILLKNIDVFSEYLLLRPCSITVSGNGHHRLGCQSLSDPNRNDLRRPSMTDSPSGPTILFVDDDIDIQSAARLLLTRRGFHVLAAHNAPEAFTRITAQNVDLVLLDLNYAPGATSGAEGLALLKELLALRPHVPVIVVTGHSGVSIAVAAIRAGAADFVMKPWSNERLITLLQNTLQNRRGAPSEIHGEQPFLCGSDLMRRLLEKADRVAATRAHILISGPTGTGKSLLARRICAHATDDVSSLSIDGESCEALPQGGDVWVIDGIERLTPPLQRALADRLDSATAPRIIALTGSIESDPTKFHPALQLHIGTIHIALPPLEGREEDIVALARHFLRYFAARHGYPEPALDDDHLSALAARPWPQNVRELRQVMERFVLRDEVNDTAAPVPGTLSPGTLAPGTLEDAERSLIETTLRRHGFNVTRAARELGLTRPALYRRMARHGL